jgi:hypothetical protein
MVENVIAVRHLEFVPAEGVRESFTVSIMLPVLAEDGNDYYCTHKIESESTNKTFNIFGIDSVQALDLSLKSVTPYLEHLEKVRNGKFCFLGEAGHCFPK